ncbi:hypothetical protein EAH_00018710 [Eimeria acervulina]|uniref:Uncharacterized protein n=1 Tax=Eimeria acervulina TaxID=5801 RepID=U6GMU7_EIMAC|nr:hypothetical protein EAH_00018710 [Eimeria acervulina]CDI80912.1 hypothetical protein EAH_00018710 [Eimeria acervulina]
MRVTAAAYTAHMTQALPDWARAVVGAEPEEASSLLACSASRFLVNLSVTLSFLQSGGATVDLKVCNEEWQEHTQQISIPPASIAV